jgi:hypothetical protein
MVASLTALAPGHSYYLGAMRRKTEKVLDKTYIRDLNSRHREVRGRPTNMNNTESPAILDPDSDSQEADCENVNRSKICGPATPRFSVDFVMIHSTPPSVQGKRDY